jgi:sugar/nucleoside kinase (ribokinase family)
MSQRLAVTAIGDALVDVIVRAEDDFLAANGITKGGYQMLDDAAAEALYANMGPGTEVSGGSAANTMAVMANLGVPTGFIGKVKNDQLGAVFTHDIRAVGVEFLTAPATDGPGTGRCLILVSPDGERSMSTSLGCAQKLSALELDAKQLMRSDIFYIEGYMWNDAATKEAIVQGIQVAHRAGNRAALTLSDTFCVNSWCDEFVSLVGDHIDLLFANEHELMALSQAADFDAALVWLRGRCDIAAITRSEKGAVILAGNDTFVIAAEPVAKVVDATGAGDAYAGGFMAGLAHGKPLDVCGRMGAICAAEVISHIGPRPEADLKVLVARTLG